MTEKSAIHDRRARSIETGQAGWGWILAYGLILVLLGIFAFLNPLATGLATGILLSIGLIFLGVAAIAAGISALSRRRRWAEIIVGVVSLAAGILTIFDPFAGALSLVFLVSLWLLACGVFELIGAFRAPYDRIWHMLLGVIDGALGLFLLFNGPVAGLAFLAAAVGISFVLRGLFLTIVALDLRKFGP